MPRRRIGQETFGFDAADRVSALDALRDLIDWAPVKAALEAIPTARRGEVAWPPLALLKAPLIAVRHDLSDVKPADALEDRASFRRFCGFSRHEATPERTAFVRFRRVLIAQGLDQVVFELVNQQLRTRSVAVRTGTLADATVIASASRGDGEAGWSGHRSRKAVHSYKAHVAADAETARVERVDVTPGNVHDRRAGAVLPDDPGVVYADRAYRGSAFTAAVVAKGGEPRVVATHCWAREGDAVAEAAFLARNGAIHRVHARIEKIFGTWTRSCGLRRMRWRGPTKAALQVRLTAIAYNLRRGVSLLQAA